MDFLNGILMFVLIFFIIYNYVSVSVSKTQGGGTCSNNILSINQNGNGNQYQNENQYQNGNQYKNGNQNYSIPSPMQSKSSTALNSKVNLNDHTYDYNQQFFVPSPTVFNNQANLNNPRYNYKQFFFV